MSAKKAIFAGVIVLCVVALISTTFERLAARTARERLDALVRQRSNAQTEASRLRRALSEYAQKQVVLRQQMKAAAAEKSRSDSSAAILRNGILGWTDLRYGRLFKKLGLTQAQIGQFMSLMLDYQLAMRDIAESARANGISPDDPNVAQLLQQEAERFHTAEAGLLGETGYQQLLEDNRTSEPRNWVNGLAGNLYFSEPLSADQQDKLVQILASQSPDYQSGGAASTKQIQDWNATFAKAQGVLSPTQLEAMISTQATYQAGLHAVQETLALQPPEFPTPTPK